MLQFDLQFYEELTVAWVRTVKFISGAFLWPTGQLVFKSLYHAHPRNAKLSIKSGCMTPNSAPKFENGVARVTMTALKPNTEIFTKLASFKLLYN